jgi:transposase
VRYIGLDVHKRQIEMCMIDAEGQVLQRDRLSTDRRYLEAFAQHRLRPTDQVALEATTNTWAVVRILQPHVAGVTVSNPLATKAIATAKVKTDKVDALVLAQLLRCGYLPSVWIPDEATQQLRELTSRRASLVNDRTSIRNRIHAVLATRLILPPAAQLFSSKGMDWLRTVELDAEGRMLVDSDLALLAALDIQITALDKHLAARGWQEQRVKLLMTLPGVDLAVAQSLLAALGDVQRFRDADHAAAYLGLVPSTRQSAEHCYHGSITKRGRSHTRWMMVQAAQHAGRHPGPLGCFFRRLAKKKNRNVAVVAAARKLVVIAWHMLTTGQPYRYAVPKSTATKLARLRIRATGRRRKSGLGKGIKCQAKLPGGSVTIKPLAEIYRLEGLPTIAPPAAAEQRALDQSDAAPFIASLVQTHVVPRARKAKTPTAQPLGTLPTAR